MTKRDAREKKKELRPFPQSTARPSWENCGKTGQGGEGKNGRADLTSIRRPVCLFRSKYRRANVSANMAAFPTSTDRPGLVYRNVRVPLATSLGQEEVARAGGRGGKGGSSRKTRLKSIERASRRRWPPTIHSPDDRRRLARSTRKIEFSQSGSHDRHGERQLARRAAP